MPHGTEESPSHVLPRMAWYYNVAVVLSYCIIEILSYTAIISTRLALSLFLCRITQPKLRPLRSGSRISTSVCPAPKPGIFPICCNTWILPWYLSTDPDLVSVLTSGSQSGFLLQVYSSYLTLLPTLLDFPSETIHFILLYQPNQWCGHCCLPTGTPMSSQTPLLSPKTQSLSDVSVVFIISTTHL